MKKIKMTLICLCLLITVLFPTVCFGNPFTNAKVGDYVKMGNYPQTKNGEIQPIECLVLSRKENKILVISRYGLEAKCFDNGSENRLETNDWNKSDIRQWANNDFYHKAFSENEKKMIKTSKLPDVGTIDKIFLLSQEEAEKYFANDEARKCKSTDYALKTGAWEDDGWVTRGEDEVYVRGYSNWWLRTPDYLNGSCVYYVYCNGDFSSSESVDRGSFVFRPALWINL